MQREKKWNHYANAETVWSDRINDIVSVITQESTIDSR